MAYIDNQNAEEILIGTLAADTLDATLAMTPTVLVGQAGNDSYIVKDVGDIVVEESGGGLDTVYSLGDYSLGSNVEYLYALTGSAVSLTGNDLANTIVGGDAADILDGGTGADILYGGMGDDTYVVDHALDKTVEASNAGADLVRASVSYVLAAEIEDLELVGGSNINGTGNAGDNILTGTGGNNRLSGLEGNDTLYGSDGNDVLLGGGGINYLFGELGDDTLYGGSGIDVLDGGAGADYMAGGAGDDTYYADASDKPVVEAAGAGTDKVIALSSYTLAANIEDLILDAAAGVANGTGNALNNEVRGNDDDNDLFGLAGNDLLDGRGGTDRMWGGLGDDAYHVYDASDVATEYLKQGTDKVFVMGNFSYGLGDNVENLELTAGTDGTGNGLDNEIIGNDNDNVLSGFAGNDTLYGRGGNDTLDGGGGNDKLIGEGGNDAMAGGAGDDTYYVESAGDTVSESAGEGTDTIVTELSYVLAANVEVEILRLAAGLSSGFDLTGNAGDNTLIGDANANVLDGGAGADRMEGGAGNDTYVVDDINDVVVEALNAGRDLVESDLGYILGANVDDLTLTGAGDLSGTGNALANTITGNGGDNVLNGVAGDDILYGMGGDDTLFGGLGNDTLNGGSGVDIMQGGAGDDRYYVDDASDSVTEAAAAGTDTIFSTIDFDLRGIGVLNTVESLTLIGAAGVDGFGNDLNNVLTGNSGDNQLFGGAGNDTLSGASGNDTLAGETGNDIYYIIDTSETVVENANEGTDTVKTTVTRGALEANVENLVLLGSASIDGIGNAGNNVITGNDGGNLLDGGGGVDRLIGGKGDDTYVVDTTTDVLVELAGQGNDVIQFAATVAGAKLIMAAYIESVDTVTAGVALNVTGNASDNVIQGNDAVNVIDGGAGNDILNGGDGDDTLLGNLGNDVLSGQSGNDILQGGAGNDTYSDVDAGDAITELAGGGIDTVETAIDGYSLAVASLVNVENLVLLGAAITGTGNSLANSLTGNGQDNTLDGGAGNDILDGGAGDDMMIGGTGNDTYIVDSLNDAVVETAAGAAGGIDTVKTDLDFDISLLLNVENIVLTGLGDVDAIGNTLANALTGNDGNNILTGDAGNDILKGGGGNDRLEGGVGVHTILGGAGDDHYVVDSASDVVTELANEGIDTVESTVSRTLGANQENLWLIGGANINGTGNQLDNVLNGNNADNVLSGGVGSDILNGGLGLDQLFGGLGDDTFFFDPIDTVVAGNAGIDTLLFAGSGASLDLTLVPNTRYTGLEVIDLTGAGNNALIANVTDILALSDTTNRLVVDGNAGDSVSLVASGAATWTQGADDAIGGVLYHTYSAGLATVYVDADVTALI